MFLWCPFFTSHSCGVSGLLEHRASNPAQNTKFCLLLFFQCLRFCSLLCSPYFFVSQIAHPPFIFLAEEPVKWYHTRLCQHQKDSLTDCVIELAWRRLGSVSGWAADCPYCVQQIAQRLSSSKPKYSKPPPLGKRSPLMMAKSSDTAMRRGIKDLEKENVTSWQGS